MPLPAIEFSGISEIGPVREDNQDNLWLPGDSYPDPGGLFILADGMGGYARGREASELAIREVFRTVTSHLENGSPNGSATGLMRRCMASANVAVLNHATRTGAHRMGTTLQIGWILENQFYLAHVGDSRVYLLRGDQISCLTSDHTVVGDMVRARVIGPQDVRGHARRSYLTRAVGIGLFVQPDLLQTTLQPGDRLLMCTDGLWGVLEDNQIASLLSSYDHMSQVCRALVDQAYANDSDDNITVIAIHYRDRVKAPQRVKTASQRAGWLQRMFGRP